MRGGSVGENSVSVGFGQWNPATAAADCSGTCEQHRIALGMSDDVRFGRWLNRYALPDAFARWRAADASRAAELAFVTIASDEHVLMRLKPGVANTLATQALDVAFNMPLSKSVSELSLVAARVVEGRVRIWRRYVDSQAKQPVDDRGTLEHAAIEKAAELLVLPQDILRQAQGDFPNSRLSAGSTLMNMALRMGAQGLLQLGEPMDAVLALGAARAAARRVRGHLRSMDLPLDKCPEAIGILQQWCALTGKNPFIVPYGSAGGKISDRVTGFAFDAATCVAVAAKTSGALGSPGFDALETAEEFHAYGVMCINPDLIWNMDLDKAQHFASAAARLADAALTDPTIRLPEFPDYCEDLPTPKLVLAIARAACIAGIKPRLSTAAPVFQTVG
jgi:hypothetical protein